MIISLTFVWERNKRDDVNGEINRLQKAVIPGDFDVDLGEESRSSAYACLCDIGVKRVPSAE